MLTHSPLNTHRSAFEKVRKNASGEIAAFRPDQHSPVHHKAIQLSFMTHIVRMIRLSGSFGPYDSYGVVCRTHIFTEFIIAYALLLSAREDAQNTQNFSI